MFVQDFVDQFPLHCSNVTTETALSKTGPTLVRARSNGRELFATKQTTVSEMHVLVTAPASTFHREDIRVIVMKDSLEFCVK